MATVDELWGGQLSPIWFDPVDHSCSLHVTTVVHGRNHAYNVFCRGVVELSFHNAIPEPWTYAEVTEARLGFDRRSAQYTLEMILWSEDASLVIKCASAEVSEGVNPDRVVPG